MQSYLSLQEILKATGGRLINLCEDNKVLIHPRQICTDTRVIKKGDFFVALKGEHFDGSDFIHEAFIKGAIGAMTEKLFLPPWDDFFIVQVRNTLKALQEIAKFYRQRFSVPIIAVTGSSGKTTVKELIARILSIRYPTFKSFGNFNNQIGIPLSLLNLSPEHKVGVVELGMNRRGEIENLSRIVQPRVGVITNVYSSHLGMLGSTLEIAKAKAEIIPFLNREKDNFLILNKDNPWSDFFYKLATCKVLTFGIEKEADFMACNIKDEGIKISFELVFFKKDRVNLTLNFPGLFNVYNVLAASGACFVFGLSLKEIKEGVESFSPLPLRFQIKKYTRCNILDDCYNANPDSVKIALSVLKKLKGGKKIAVIGDMLELGEYSSKMHESVGEFAASIKIDALFAYGEFSPFVVEGAKKGGLEESFWFKDKQELLRKLSGYVKSKDWVLVKGSRKMKMEEIVEGLGKLQ